MGETNFVDGRVTTISSERLSIETSVGPIDAENRSPGFHVGTEVTLSIRPESWRLEANGSGPNAVSGRIFDRIYLGEAAQYNFAPTATPDRSFKISELNPRFITEPSDRELHARVHPEDVVVLARE
jgi:ABC-type Fe3+/spermidine/putrescine transport system ATPase subunit